MSMLINKLSDDEKNYLFDIHGMSKFSDYLADINDVGSSSLNDLIDYCEEQDIHYGYGVTKFVFIFGEAVLKIPFCGTTETNWYDDDKSIIDVMYDCAENDLCSWNYCETEMEIYEKAKSEGLSKIFADIERINDSCYLYIQEKAVSIADMDKEKRRPSRNSLEYVENNISDRYAISNEEWLASVVDWYGKEFLNRFLSFLDKDDRMDDFHRDNYGYRASDNSPCLIDWAGFRD